MLATLSVIVANVPAVVNETKNPILPVVSEMFWSGVFFLALWAMMKFVLLPPIVKTMDARAQKVRDDQAAAEAAGMVRTTMFLGIAFTEALALIGFVVFILLKFV